MDGVDWKKKGGGGGILTWGDQIERRPKGKGRREVGENCSGCMWIAATFLDSTNKEYFYYQEDLLSIAATEYSF